MADTLRASIATLLGKKPASLKLEDGVNPVLACRNLLAEQGYTVRKHDASARVSDRHVVLYSAHDGTLQSVLSDSPEAAKVTPLARLTVAKTPKSAGERQDS